MLDTDIFEISPEQFDDVRGCDDRDGMEKLFIPGSRIHSEVSENRKPER